MQDSKLLIQFNSPGQVLAAAYKRRKLQNRNFSLQFLCNKSGISSKGLLSDVINERRKLPLKNADATAKALGFSFKERRVFVLLVKIQRAKDPLEQERLNKKLRTARKNLVVQNKALTEGDYDPLVFCLVFCSLGVKNCEPTLFGISQHLKLQKGQVQKALKALLKMNYIKENRKKFSITDSSEVRFTDGDYKKFHKALILQSIEYAASALDKNFELRDSTFYESSVISVSKAKYQKALPKIKNWFDEMQSELEADQGDDLVHFNIQVHPYKT